MKDVSIAIVSYHNENDVKKAVASIEKYTPLSISKQIYIVDNSDICGQCDVTENIGNFKDRAEKKIQKIMWKLSNI